MEQPNKDLKIKIINKLMPIRFFIKGTINKNVICFVWKNIILMQNWTQKQTIRQNVAQIQNIFEIWF